MLKKLLLVFLLLTPTGFASAAVVASPTAIQVQDTIHLAQARAPESVSVTATGPSDTTISVGTLSGTVLNWVLVGVVGFLGTAFTGLIARLAAGVGVQMGQTYKDKIQATVENALYLAAKQFGAWADGKWVVDVKSQVVKDFIENYVNSHAAKELKAVGQPAGSAAAKETIEARTAKALADPAVPVQPLPPDKATKKAA
jgi:hypothetical protein